MVFLSRGLVVFRECVAKFSCLGVQCLVTTGMAVVCGTAPPITSGPGVDSYSGTGAGAGLNMH